MPQMKSSNMIEQIRKMAASGHKVRKIAKSLGISRNTVRKYLRSDTEATQEGQNEAHQGSTPGRRPPKWAASLAWEEIIQESQKGVTIKQLFAEHEPKVSYSRFCRAIRAYVEKPAPIAPRLVHVPGEKVQVDFADGLMILDRETGKGSKTHLFCGVLPFSSYTFGEFVADQQLSNFIRCHENMWAFFGGVTPYVVLDNLKSGVTKAHRYDPDTNPTYCDYGNHAGFAALPARPYTPRDKAAVEAAIGTLQKTFYQKYRDHKFYSLAELNGCFRAFLIEFNTIPMRESGVSRAEMFATEKMKLLPVPLEPYEIFEWRKAKVHPDCCVQVHHNFYSVPFRHVGQEVRVKCGTRLIEVMGADGERLACHQRAKGRGVVVIDDTHLPPQIHQESSFEIRKAKAKAESIGPMIAALVEQQLSGDRPLRHLRRVQGILRLLEQGGSRESLEYAAGQALTFGRFKLAFIKNCMAQHAVHGTRLRLAAPQRDQSTIHLHGE